MPWRQMTPADLPRVTRIAAQIHPALPEDEPVFAERLRLFPAGCLVLPASPADPDTGDSNDSKSSVNTNNNEKDNDGEIAGYITAFPILANRPPPLNTLLGEISKEADQFYLHDIAVLPAFRGRGAARAGVEKVLRAAERAGLRSCALVSVYGTAGFWGRFGFGRVSLEEEDGEDEERRELREKVRGYGPDAVWMVRRMGRVGG